MKMLTETQTESTTKTFILKDVIKEDIKHPDKKKYKWDIVWINVFILGFLHLGAIYGAYLRYYISYSSYIFIKLAGILSSIGVTAGAHRLWTHKSYKANKIVEIILISWMSMQYQNSVYIWCRDHRVHHKYSETDADPHNAKRGFFFSHVGWLLVRKHKDVIEKGKSVDLTDLETNPIVMFQHKYYYIIVFIGMFLMPLLVVHYIFGESWKYAFFVGICYRYVAVVNLTWCVNSLAHLYGDKPFDKNIGPTNNSFLKYFGWGEGFHNFHHTFPWDYRAAELGGDVRNPTTYLIDFFAWLGWVSDRKTVPDSIMETRARRTGDGTYFKKDYDYYIHIILFIIMVYTL